MIIQGVTIASAVEFSFDIRDIESCNIYGEILNHLDHFHFINFKNYSKRTNQRIANRRYL